METTKYPTDVREINFDKDRFKHLVINSTLRCIDKKIWDKMKKLNL